MVALVQRGGPKPLLGKSQDNPSPNIGCSERRLHCWGATSGFLRWNFSRSIVAHMRPALYLYLWMVGVTLLGFVARAQGQQAQTGVAGTSAVSLPQVSPGTGLNQSRGGISSVTRPTPTAVRMATAQGFFSAGGVSLGAARNPAPGVNVNPASGTGPALIGHKSVPAQVSDRELSRLAAAANRGDTRARARLTEIGLAMVSQADTGTAAPAASSGQHRRSGQVKR
jgi:hypothetical protein